MQASGLSITNQLGEISLKDRSGPQAPELALDIQAVYTVLNRSVSEEIRQ